MNIKEAFPTAEATADIRSQIAHRAADVHSRQIQLNRTRGRLVGGLVTAALVTGGVLVGPAAYAIYRLNRISGSLDDCLSMIREDYAIGEDGRTTLEGRITYANGKWRIDQKDRTQVFENGVLWSYDARLNQVLKFDKPNGPFGYNPTGVSVKSMMRDLTSWNWRIKPVLGTAKLDGRAMTTVTLDEERHRVVVYADPNTDMPVLFQSFRKEDGKVTLDGYSRPKLNVAVPDTAFTKDFPLSAPVIDVSKIRSEWAAKLEKPLARIRFTEGEIQIRDFAVNERGHVFVIYSDGETATDRAASEAATRNGEPKALVSGLEVDFEARDSLGNAYILSRSSLQPYIGGFRGQPSESIVLKDGQVLQGAWLYTADVQPWKSRKITFKLSRGNETHTWEVPASQPSVKLIPEWFRALAIAPQGPDDLLTEENRGRRGLYYREGNYAALIPLIHEEIARLEAFGREHRRRISLMDLYFNLYTAHHELGQDAEARKYLRLASLEPESNDAYSGAPMVNQSIILSALKREGMR